MNFRLDVLLHYYKHQHQHHSTNTRTILVKYVDWCILLPICLDTPLFESWFILPEFRIVNQIQV